MTDKEMIEALQNKLSESIAENSYLKEAVTLISNRQRRERIENKVTFAVEVDGEIRHESDTFEAAAQAAEFYDDAKLVTWTTTPMQYLTVAEADQC